jgi:hypothetical protein
VLIRERGLPTGTGWWVNVSGGLSSFSETENVSVGEPNGSYAYSVAATDKRFASPAGSFQVDAIPTYLGIYFSGVTYALNFVESGLPVGDEWQVQINGDNSSVSRSSEISIPELNGTYSYDVSDTDMFIPNPSSGTVTVRGLSVASQIAFSAPTLARYVVAFSESGLPNGTEWSVAFDREMITGTTILAFPPVSNGTYLFSVNVVAGYRATPGNGSIIVNGLAVREHIAFNSSSSTSGSILGLPAPEALALLGGSSALVVVAVALALLVSRSRPGPPDPAKCTTEANPPRTSRK